MRNELLLPAEGWYIVLTLFLSFVIGLLPLPKEWFVPDFLSLALLFWVVYQPHRVGILTAWILGLFVDIHRGVYLGEHALSYTVMAYCALVLNQRIRWFSVWGQVLHVVPVLMLGQLVRVAMRSYTGSGSSNWGLWLSCLVAGLLWPLICYILLSRQRRVIARDENRPL
jgi:rod shape-determining protein MreD